VKAASAPLIALLNGGNAFQVCDLYTLTLADGTVLRLTNADVPITFSGNTFATRPLVTRGKCRTIIGVEVDTLEVSIYPQASNLLTGVIWQQAARQGALDGAWIKVERAFITTWPAVVGTLVAFYGRVGDVDVLRSEIKFQVRSALELLNIQMPRNLYQAVCLNTLYDTSCQAVKAASTATASVSASPTASGFTTALGQSPGYFEQGVLTFTSGANVGLKRTVKAFAGGAFTFVSPWPTAPAIGDTFSAFAGCNKTLGTCTAKFGNIAHFRGFPEIPVPETVY
jgi:uncharacterized phage protein (TIGR02218 family)